MQIFQVIMLEFGLAQVSGPLFGGLAMGRTQPRAHCPHLQDILRAGSQIQALLILAGGLDNPWFKRKKIRAGVGVSQVEGKSPTSNEEIGCC